VELVGIQSAAVSIHCRIARILLILEMKCSKVSSAENWLVVVRRCWQHQSSPFGPKHSFIAIARLMYSVFSFCLNSSRCALNCNCHGNMSSGDFLAVYVFQVTCYLVMVSAMVVVLKRRTFRTEANSLR